MIILRLCYLPCLILFALAAMGAAAQTAPPLKPGLWEIHIDHEVDGQKMPDMSERMKNMSPEVRAQVEAMMKKQGLGLSQGGVNKVCYSRESIDQNSWAETKTGCKTDFSSRTATTWKWHSSCPQYGSESDGEATFTGSESYVLKVTSVSKIEDKARNSKMTINGKFLSSDCGDIKPLSVKPTDRD